VARIALWCGVVAVALLSILLQASPVQAQATRTWVSGVGDDANPCSRTAPCKTFAGAISKTAAGGEINVIDPGGFGAVTITKSITIDGGGTFASVLSVGTNGIVVNGAGVIVTLRNLSINGAGTGVNGIRFVQGSVLHVENCIIENHRPGTTGNGFGIQFQPNTAAELYVINTTLADNGTAGVDGGGVQIKPVAGGSANVILSNIRVENNLNGIVADGTGGGGAIKMTVRDSTAAGNTGQGIIGTSSGVSVQLMVDRTAAVNNGTGIQANGSGVGILIGFSTITGNATGVAATNSGALASYKNNEINNNTTDGTPIPQVNLN
jgi:hypothetical protein